MYNKKELKVTPKPEGKKNPYKNDIIYDPMGQWAHPGEVTRIPSGDITMQGVPYPVMGIDNFGNVQMMMPGQDYSFPGDIVDEYPMAKKGGVPRSLKKMYTSKNIQSSINEILMKRNDTLFGPSGRRYYKPMQEGGETGWLDEFQDGSEVPLNSDQEFLINMANSPLFGERFSKMMGQAMPVPYRPSSENPYNVPYDPETYRKNIINNIRSVKYAEEGTGDFSQGKNGLAPMAYYMKGVSPEDAEAARKAMKLLKISDPSLEMKLDNPHTIFKKKGLNKYVNTHETSHASTEGGLYMQNLKPANFAIPNDQLNDLGKRLYAGTKNYYQDPAMQAYLSEPTEVKARLDSIRKNLKDKGLYDPVKEKFTEKHYDKLFELNDRENTDVRDIFMNFPKEEVIRLFNETVSNNPKQLNIAQYGGQSDWLDRYDKGGPLKVNKDLNQAFMRGEGRPTAQEAYLMQLDKFNREHAGKQATISADSRPESVKKAAKKRMDYIENPTVMDYIGQAGYIPLLALSNPFEIPEKLKEIRTINSDPALTAGQKFDQLGNIGTDATKWALLNAATEGATEGLAPIIGTLGKKGKDAVVKAVQNTHKINPWAFKPNPEAYYRGVGKEGIEDALKTGVIKSRDTDLFPAPYFARPTEFETALYYNPEGLVEAKGIDISKVKSVNNDDLIFRNKDAGAIPLNHQYVDEVYLGNNTPGFKTSGLENIPITNPNVRLLQKDWLRGYKQVDVPSQLPGSPNKFKSEIDWEKWNSEIPQNKELMDEYLAIEQQAKANDNWLKNPDGSVFEGTPEQFVQQNSKNFRKAYPKGLEKVYRGTDGEMNTEKLAELYPKGRGIFTADKKTAQHYAGSKGKLNELYHPSSSNSYDIDVEGRSWREVPIENLPNMSSRKTLFGKPIADTDDIATWMENNNIDYVNMKNIFDGTDAEFSRIVNNKPGNYLKSARGNNGMFDMSNPNIYKALIPFMAGAAAMQSEKKKGGQVDWLSEFE